MKTATVWIEDGVFALFFRPHHRTFGAQVSQPPGICSSKQGKNNANARGLARAGGGCISWQHSAPRELVAPIFSKISRGSTVYAGFFSSIASAEFKRNFTLKRSPRDRQLIKRITKLLNFPPFWEKVFLTLSVPLSYQKQF